MCHLYMHSFCINTLNFNVYKSPSFWDDKGLLLRGGSVNNAKNGSALWLHFEKDIKSNTSTHLYLHNIEKRL